MRNKNSHHLCRVPRRKLSYFPCLLWLDKKNSVFSVYSVVKMEANNGIKV